MMRIEDLSKYEYCEGPGPHNSDDDSCSGGCGGYGFWSASVTPADILALLREWGGEEVWWCDKYRMSGSKAICSTAGTMFPGHDECGPGLVVPVDVLAADTGKEQ